MPSTQTIHVGSAGFSKPRPRYAKKLSFAEIELRSPLPTPKTLASWRSEVGEDFVFSVIGPAVLWGERDWPLRDEKSVQSEIDRLSNVMHGLKPRVLVLRTPISIRPGTPALKRFLSAAAALKKLAPICVWEPLGVWERDAAVEVATPVGLVVASDPLRDSIEGESVVYARMRGLGSDRRYHQGRLEDLADALSAAEEVFVVFDTDNSFREAGLLGPILSGQASESDDADGEEHDDENEDLDDDEDDSDEDEDEDADDFEDEDEDGDDDDDDDDEDEDDEDDEDEG